MPAVGAQGIIMIDNIKYIVFLFFFIIFFFEDIRKHSVNNIIFILYLIVGVCLVYINIYNRYREFFVVDFSYIVEVVLSIMLGSIIYVISIFSKEAIGKGDALYFIINGLYLSLVENVSLFVIGIFVSTIISIFIYIIHRGKVKNIIIPFIPCLLPSILWRIVCIQ